MNLNLSFFIQFGSQVLIFTVKGAVPEECVVRAANPSWRWGRGAGLNCSDWSTASCACRKCRPIYTTLLGGVSDKLH